MHGISVLWNSSVSLHESSLLLLSCLHAQTMWMTFQSSVADLERALVPLDHRYIGLCVLTQGKSFLRQYFQGVRDLFNNILSLSVLLSNEFIFSQN